jgi:hypothetical protein
MQGKREREREREGGRREGEGRVEKSSETYCNLGNSW